MKVLSLFDGISCGMVALERAKIPVERYVAYEIDVNAIKIDSALLSAQHRERLYWTNINFDIPYDKKIMLNDVLDFTDEIRFRPISKWVYSYWGDKQKIDSIPKITEKKPEH